MSSGVGTIVEGAVPISSATTTQKANFEEPQITKKARNTITLAATLGYLFDAYAINIYGMTLALIALDFGVSIQTMGAIGSVFIPGYMLGSRGFGVLGGKSGPR